MPWPPRATSAARRRRLPITAGERAADQPNKDRRPKQVHGLSPGVAPLALRGTAPGGRNPNRTIFFFNPWRVIPQPLGSVGNVSAGRLQGSLHFGPLTARARTRVAAPSPQGGHPRFASGAAHFPRQVGEFNPFHA